jgi:GNAT superfamily N-acetyltransferase
VIIRPAIPEDHEALQTHLWALNQFEQEISGDRRIDRAGATDSLAEALDTVAQQDGAEQAGRIAGHLFMYFEMDDVYVREDLRSYALISNLFVDEALRGQGVGRALMAEAEKIAAARGVEPLP